MGQLPLTGTTCVYPFANTSTTPECSQLCADVLGAKFQILRVVSLVVASLGCVVFLYQFRIVYRAYQEELRSARMMIPLQRAMEFRFFVGIMLLSFLTQ
jgi:hypothetical protein